MLGKHGQEGGILFEQSRLFEAQGYFCGSKGIRAGRLRFRTSVSRDCCQRRLGGGRYGGGGNTFRLTGHGRPRFPRLHLRRLQQSDNGEQDLENADTSSNIHFMAETNIREVPSQS